MSLKACAGRLCSKGGFCAEICRSNQGPFVEKRCRSKEKALCVIIRGTACCTCCRAVPYRRVGWDGRSVGFCRVVGPLSSHHVSCVMSGKSEKRYDDACVACNGANATHEGRIEEASMNQSIIYEYMYLCWVMGDHIRYRGPCTSPSSSRGKPEMSEKFCRSKPSYFKVTSPACHAPHDVPARK